MSARDAAVRAVAEALGSPTGNQWRGAYGAIPADPDAWHYAKKAAHIAIAALATSADVRAGLVAAVNAAEGWWDRDAARTADAEGLPMPGIRVWPLVDAVLAALGGGADG